MFDKYISKLLVKKVFSFSEDQILMLNKVPFVLFPARGMARFIQEATEEIGEEELTKIAYDAGIKVAQEFVDRFQWAGSSLPGKMSAIKKMFEVMGFGSIDVKIWNAKENKLYTTVTHHPVIEKAKEMYGTDEKICPFYMAIYSAHIHNELGIENCWLKETQCICKGAKFCEWSHNVFNAEGKELSE